VNVNIKPESKVTFNLTYEELLSRKLGRYEHTINIIPEQVRRQHLWQLSVSVFLFLRLCLYYPSFCLLDLSVDICEGFPNRSEH